MPLPATWADIKHSRLTRHPDVLKRYQDFKSHLAHKGLTLADYMRRHLRRRGGEEIPVLVPNQFPYWVAPGIEHWVLWSLSGPLHNAAAIRAAITAQRPVWAREVLWFENPPAAKTIPELWHIHVFFR